MLVALGAVFGRCGDDVLMHGARTGSRFADDAIVGAAAPRMATWGSERVAGSTADDVARFGGTKVDRLAAPAGRAGGLGDDVARLGPGRVAVPRMHAAGLGDDAALAGEGPWFETLRDFGVDVGVELVTADLDGGVPTVVATPGQLRCPRHVDITRAPAAWDELLGGFGIACAPVVVLGTASDDGRALHVGERPVPLLELAQACAGSGGRCVLVGCPEARADACMAETEQSFERTPLQPTLRGYVRAFVKRAFAQSVPPVVVAELAEVDGAATLVIARPGAAVDP